jgi:hypothetical protein
MERTLPNALYQSHYYSHSKTWKGHNKKENYKPISLLNKDTNILNKILAN